MAVQVPGQYPDQHIHRKRRGWTNTQSSQGAAFEISRRVNTKVVGRRKKCVGWHCALRNFHSSLEVVNHTCKMLPDPDYSVSRKSSGKPRKTRRIYPGSNRRNWRLICDVLYLRSNGKLMQVLHYSKTSIVNITGKALHLHAKIPSPHFVSTTTNISITFLRRR
jgi:hypothetical protein